MVYQKSDWQRTLVRDCAQSSTNWDHLLGPQQNELDITSEVPEAQYAFNLPKEELEPRTGDFDISTFTSSNFDVTDLEWANMAEQSSLLTPAIPENYQNRLDI